jgi:hypothetical protein
MNGMEEIYLSGGMVSYCRYGTAPDTRCRMSAASTQARGAAVGGPRMGGPY